MWKAEQVGSFGDVHKLTDEHGKDVAFVTSEHAQVIVRAVNSHRELVEALTYWMPDETMVAAEEWDRWNRDIAAIERART